MTPFCTILLRMFAILRLRKFLVNGISRINPITSEIKPGVISKIAPIIMQRPSVTSEVGTSCLSMERSARFHVSNPCILPKISPSAAVPTIRNNTHQTPIWLPTQTSKPISSKLNKRKPIKKFRISFTTFHANFMI